MIESLLKSIARGLDKEKIPYMIIGGQAVLVYGFPRMTQDIDITLGIDAEHYLKVQGLCKRAGFKILIPEPENFVKQTNVLPVEDITSKIRIDFIFSYTPYERQAIKRSRKISINHYPVRFASLDDLIIHKIFAGRAVDEEDIKILLIKNRGNVDIRYIKRWLREFSKLHEHKGLIPRFNRLLRQIK